MSGPPEIFEAQENTELSLTTWQHILRGAADKLAPSVREMGWMQLSHSFSPSIRLTSQVSTCFPACSSLCDTRILFPFGEYQLLISCEPRLLLFLQSQLSLFLENFHPCTSYFASFLLKPLPSFSSKVGHAALWLQGHHPWLLQHCLDACFKDIAAFCFDVLPIQKWVKFVGMTHLHFRLKRSPILEFPQ